MTRAPSLLVGEPYLVTAPAVEPITPAEVRARLGLPSTVSDDVLTPLILAARMQVEAMTGRALITQTWERVFDGFPCGMIELARPPVQSVVALAYLSNPDTEVVVDPEAYRLRKGMRAFVIPVGAWPSAPGLQTVRLRWVSGYGAAGTNVDEPLRQAIVLSVAYQRSLMRPDVALRREEVTGVGARDWVVTEAAGAAYGNAVRSLISQYMVPSA